MDSLPQLTHHVENFVEVVEVSVQVLSPGEKQGAVSRAQRPVFPPLSPSFGGCTGLFPGPVLRFPYIDHRWKGRESMSKKIQQTYAAFAQYLGLQVDDSGAIYGQRGGFSWTIFPADPRYPYQLRVCTAAQRASGALTKEEIRTFKTGRKPVIYMGQQLHTISITVNAKGAMGQNHLSEALDAFATFLHTQSFHPCCQNCGQAQPTEGYYVSGGYMQLCPACVETLTRNHNSAQLQQKQKSENLLGGIVGSLIGSLLGVVCIILLSQLGYVAAFSGIVMAVCTLKGYELLGGKLSNRGIVISVVVMVIMIFVGDRIDWAILVSQQVDVPLPVAFRAIPDLLAQELILPSAYWGNLVLLYIFTLAGAIPTVRSSVRNRRVRNIIYRLGRQPVEQ